MSELLDRLKAGKSARSIVKLNGIELSLRALSEQDYMEAGIAAESAMKAAKIELSMSTAELFEAEKSSQLLLLALLDPSGEPLAYTASSLRNALSREESAYLVEQYLAHEKSISPSERNMPEKEFQALLEEVKKTPGTPRLNDLSIATLKRLITVLACPPAN